MSAPGINVLASIQNVAESIEGFTARRLNWIGGAVTALVGAITFWKKYPRTENNLSALQAFSSDKGRFAYSGEELCFPKNSVNFREPESTITSVQVRSAEIPAATLAAFTAMCYSFFAWASLWAVSKIQTRQARKLWKASASKHDDQSFVETGKATRFLPAELRRLIRVLAKAKGQEKINLSEIINEFIHCVNSGFFDYSQVAGDLMVAALTELKKMNLSERQDIINHILDRDGNTLAHIAAKLGGTNAATLIAGLEDLEFDFNITNKHGATARIIALQHGNTEIAQKIFTVLDGKQRDRGNALVLATSAPQSEEMSKFIKLMNDVGTNFNELRQLAAGLVNPSAALSASNQLLLAAPSDPMTSSNQIHDSALSQGNGANEYSSSASDRTESKRDTTANQTVGSHSNNHNHSNLAAFKAHSSSNGNAQLSSLSSATSGLSHSVQQQSAANAVNTTLAYTAHAAQQQQVQAQTGSSSAQPPTQAGFEGRVVNL